MRKTYEVSSVEWENTAAWELFKRSEIQSEKDEARKRCKTHEIIKWYENPLILIGDRLWLKLLRRGICINKNGIKIMLWKLNLFGV